MSNSLNKKAEVEDLSELRDFLITKLEGFNNECTKKFSDKNETLKYFKYFEEQIKNLLSSSKTKSDSHMPENWLLATKPITVNTNVISIFPILCPIYELSYLISK